ncbi:LptF/LptG family permease [Chlorobium phaeobacteroides]|jgi:lipopolysaccharide export system permease protein|uniref:Permease YjgP/YjgQ family protein n=1 Tax=Chlorobium phaeobacteroides (strain DSM 266 / SMG 266 / 2430) TaxID=290317 RepID=A1BI11_CHLPD|nr:LptF/LptG family permease [Chlorobium phaeobacteroides]ABL66038.1 permease YjgP/YjgQ family protein [Chlorobium phaeobacteroides DSM 266]MBV5326458.1 LptF/LptG family permease [Chlorobium sp.]
MKLLDRYIFRQFAVSFFFASAAFIALFILISMVENLDEFIDLGIGPGKITGYYLSSIPSTLMVTSPVAALLSAILVAGKLSAMSELSAIKSAGISLKQLLKPFVLGGTIICSINMLNSCWLGPAAAADKIAFERTSFNRTQNLQANSNMHILESGNRIVSIGELLINQSKGLHISIEQFNGTRLSTRMDAPEMIFDQNVHKWVLKETSSRSFTGNNEQYHLNPGNDTLGMAMSLKSLRKLNVQPDEMNILEHYRYTREKDKAGFSGLDRAKVKLHAKIALPFASLISILIGVPLSTIRKRGGKAAEFSITLFIGFLYLGLQKTIATIGYTGLLEPWIAAWLPNMLFLIVAGILYKTAE